MRNDAEWEVDRGAARAGGNRAASIPIVLACDANFAMQLATVLRSLVENNVQAWPLDVHVFWEGPEEACRKVQVSLPDGAATIRWIPADLTPFHGYSVPPGLSPMANARILIPYVFPESVERVLYLDADMLVLDGLEAMWRIDLEGAVAGAVPDLSLRWVLDGTNAGLTDAELENHPAVAGLLRYWEEALAAVPMVGEYLNSGMLLIDLPRWRAERISEQALDYLSKHPTSPFPDQDALNVACDGRWMSLDSRWNNQEHLLVDVSELEPAQRPAIVHFATSNKPWAASALNRNAALWDRYRSRTRFARTAPERITDAMTAGLHRTKRVLLRLPLIPSLWRSLKRRRAKGIPSGIRFAGRGGLR